LRFFFDANISTRIVRALQHLTEGDGCQLVHLSERFPEGAADIVWISELSSQGSWILVSGDISIRRRPDERRVFELAKLPAFFLAKGWVNVSLWDQAVAMVKCWPTIMQHAKRCKSGDCYEVPLKFKSKFNRLA
jgi:hypothetical protein